MQFSKDELEHSEGRISSNAKDTEYLEQDSDETGSVSEESSIRDIENRRDDSFYFTDVVFLVDGRLFKVPRWPFEQNSKVFRDMFELPAPGGTPDGISDHQPLRLEGIKGTDFRYLLRVLYPRTFRKDDITSLDEWTSVLKLSTMWEFVQIRELSIQKIIDLKIDAVKRIVLAREYKITEWLVPALNELVIRKEPMGVKDAERLGIYYTLGIAAIRECHKCGYYGSTLVTEERPVEVMGLDFTENIRKAFRL